MNLSEQIGDKVFKQIGVCAYALHTPCYLIVGNVGDFILKRSANAIAVAVGCMGHAPG